ncbi:glycosyltransferase family protein [Nodosilinea sp. LEGE 07088]|uniref:cytidylyltransferase domain-containing protein n=1 Tax=Nodosilinea sp. LEGE 07088 TaxID=2777968 RepID=UPI0018812BE3|nr:glycosyltransferase family protein [Nodosilinea sp. LEGE 07088]MBE9138811.1 glycosyltransferase family protein [Nodosilinea sp. LEGE 07088]
MTTAIIVQARMTSTRLPGKVLKPVLGQPLLSYQIERLKRVTLADVIAIATTTNAADDPIVELSESLAVGCFRGAEHDVLSRYFGAAQAYAADVVVRVTSDCPLIDPQIMDEVIGYYLSHRDRYDYISNSIQRTYPRGLDTEVFSTGTLEQAHREATAPPEREHVTPFIYNHPERYAIGQVTSPQDLSHHRWTVDTPEDFELIRRMLETLYPQVPNFTLQDCLDVIAQQPAWPAINSHIEQKAYGQ